MTKARRAGWLHFTEVQIFFPLGLFLNGRVWMIFHVVKSESVHKSSKGLGPDSPKQEMSGILLRTELPYVDPKAGGFAYKMNENDRSGLFHPLRQIASWR